jgi:subtilisin family serine protease
MKRALTRLTIILSLLIPVGVVGSASSAAATDDAPTLTEIIVWLSDDPDDYEDDVQFDRDQLDSDEFDVAQFDIGPLAAEHGVVVLDSLVRAKGVYLLGAPVDLDEKLIKKLFDKDDRIRYAEQNFEVGSADGYRLHAWPSGRSVDRGEGGRGELGIDVGDAHAHATGAGVDVAILDTGIDSDHPFLTERVLPGWDFVDDDDDPDDEAGGLDSDLDGIVDEAWGHGTHIGGIVAQIAPDARIMPYRVLDSDGVGHTYALAAAIFDAVDRGADVINLSFGLDHHVESRMLKDAMEYARKQDVLVVAAAGNDADDQKRYPAAEKEVLSVGAIDQESGTVASFGNHGGWVQVGAPGVDVLSTLPGGRIGTWSGSSMAAPYVSGQAALLMQHAPEAKAKQIAHAIRKSSRKPDIGPKLGNGIIDIVSSFLELD